MKTTAQKKIFLPKITIETNKVFFFFRIGCGIYNTRILFFRLDVGYTGIRLAISIRSTR